MDKKSKALSPRVERRRKWYQEKRKFDKEKLRVTRARTLEHSEQKKHQAVDTAPAVSERGFKTKFNVPQNNTGKSKINNKSQKKLKRKHSENDSNGEVAKTYVKNKVKQEVEVEVKAEEMEDKPAKTTPKKAKLEYVDAVDKLENSTSVHIPKRYILFVGNLPDDVTKEQVEEHFRKTGGVKSVRLPRDRVTDQTKGFAFVEFNSTISHRIALRLHNTTLCGRKIVVEFTLNGKITKKQLESIKERDQSDEALTLKMPFDT